MKRNAPIEPCREYAQQKGIGEDPDPFSPPHPFSLLEQYTAIDYDYGDQHGNEPFFSKGKHTRVEQK